MRTTLKRGVGRGAGLNGQNGHAALPPAPATRIVRYTAEPRRRSRGRIVSRILLALLLTVIGVGAAVGGGALLYLHEQLGDVRAHSPAVVAIEPQIVLTPPGHAAIGLLLGYDARKGAGSGGPSRSDTLMLVRADPQTKTISLLSFPRDLGVPVFCPGKKKGSPDIPYGTDKINSAYADGGPKCSVDTIRHLTNLPINYVVTVNFHGFKEIVDKLGGIWMDVDRRYYHVNNGTIDQNYANINIRPGYQLLTGEQALDFVRYRHTDDDYHRIARQQEFIRAFKQQLAGASITDYPSIVHTVAKNVEVAGDTSDQTVLRWMLFVLHLPGGHFFQDKIQNIQQPLNSTMTYTPQQNITAALDQFTHPDVKAPKAANAAALGKKMKKPKAPPPSKTSVLVLNGNGVEGSAAQGRYALEKQGYVVVVPPNGAGANAPQQNHFHTAVYYDDRQAGSRLAAKQLAKLIVPSDVGPLPKNRRLRALDPGAMVVVVLGETFHNQLVTAPPEPPAPTHQLPQVSYDSTTGLGLVQPYAHRAGFKLEVPTVLARYSTPDNCCGDQAARLYWMNQKHHQKGLRLVFRTPANEYWGIEETNMPNPPILSDKSFQHAIKGREFSLYYSGSSLQMVVLRVHDRSYWVVNTLLDSLSNETMLAIAQGLKPLTTSK